MAEFPNTLRNLIKPDTISEDGSYSVSLYDVGLDAWTVVVVDDLVPCKKRWPWESVAEPLFANVAGAYLWPLIFEKAFAKYCSSYSNLDGGNPSWVWQAVTGCSAQVWYRKVDTYGWEKNSLNVERQRHAMSNGNRMACPFYGYGEAQLDECALWDHLSHADQSNYLMGASIRATIEREYLRPDGLVEGHMYSILCCVDFEDVRLIKLRCPWGKSEWNGDWSIGWPGWEKHRSVRRALEPKKLADGCFWIDLDDFCHTFTDVRIALIAMPVPRNFGHMDFSSRNNALQKHGFRDDIVQSGLLSTAPRERLGLCGCSNQKNACVAM